MAFIPDGSCAKPTTVGALLITEAVQYGGGLGKEISQESCSIGCLPSSLTAVQVQTLNLQELDRKGVLYPHFKSEEAAALVNVNLSAFQLHSNLKNIVSIYVERQ